MKWGYRLIKRYMLSAKLLSISATLWRSQLGNNLPAPECVVAPNWYQNCGKSLSLILSLSFKVSLARDSAANLRVSTRVKQISTHKYNFCEHTKQFGTYVKQFGTPTKRSTSHQTDPKEYSVKCEPKYQQKQFLKCVCYERSYLFIPLYNMMKLICTYRMSF